MKNVSFLPKNDLKPVFLAVRVMALCSIAALSYTLVHAQTASAPVVIDPKAVRILKEMTDRYSKMTSFQQVTTYSSVMIPLNQDDSSDAVDPASESDVSKKNNKTTPQEAYEKIAKEKEPSLQGGKPQGNAVRLKYKTPNRLRLEFSFPGEKGKQESQSKICDGKYFWSYDSEKNLYSKSKAPKKLLDLIRIGKLSDGTIEMAMLLGIDPFADTLKGTLGVHLTGEETVGDQQAEIVTIASETEEQLVQTRLYIGLQNRLLLRMQVETVPKTTRTQPLKALPVSVNPLDELKDPIVAPVSAVVNAAPDDPANNSKVIVTIENEVKSDPVFDLTSFAFEPPASAFREGNLNEKVDVKSWRKRIEELAKKNRKEKTGRPRVLKF